MEALYSKLELDPLNDTQVKILEGAKECVLRWGQAKTSLNDIAKVAGVTRPTIYAYYKSKDEVIKQALLYSGYEFARKLMEHIDEYDTVDERYLEAMLFAIEALPKEPYLSVIAHGDLTEIMKEDALTNPKGILICMEIFSHIFREQDMSEQALYGIVELTVRVALSFIMIESPQYQTKEQLRNFLQKRFLPLIHLP